MHTYYPTLYPTLRPAFGLPFSVWLITWACLNVPLAAQSTTHYEGQHADPLAMKWEWAVENGKQGNAEGFWIGYRIDRLMERRSFIGSFSKSRISRDQSMYALIGEPERFDESLLEIHTDWSFRGNSTFRFTDEDDGVFEHEKILKEVALLLFFEPGDSRADRVKISSMSLSVDLEDRPLLWLDHAGAKESVDLLLELYPGLQTEDVKEDIIAAVGMHETQETSVPFLIDILKGPEGTEIRETAAFWLGQQESTEGLRVLEDVAQKDRSTDVREKAVFAISQMAMPEATDVLIGLARTSSSREIRKDAIFWLAQKASEKALETIEESIQNEDDAKVQEHAVFALSQFDADIAVPRLIDIAYNHPSLNVRKKAIFWLGDSGDDRALEALIEIVERK